MRYSSRENVHLTQVEMMSRTGIFSLVVLLLLPLFVAFAYENSPQPKRVIETPESSLVVESERAQVKAISNKIDQLVISQLKKHDQKQNDYCSDEVFLRRIYLDVIGRIPTLGETNEFLDSNKTNKRELLIDHLLESYGYVSRQYNFLADLLRIKTRDNNIVGQPYIDFVKNSLEENKPYNQFVRELIVAEGPMISRDNGAVGYYLRDRNMPEDNMSNTIRIFLGTRLECAQCHDHPFDHWTQKQYYEMLAFTGGVMTRLQTIDSEHAEEITKLRRRSGDLAESEKVTLRRLIQPMGFGVAGSGTGLARLPENFMGDEGDDFDVVTAKTMFKGEEIVKPKLPTGRRSTQVNKRYPQRIRGAKEIDSRFAYADWLTSSDNPRFTKVIANRLWKQAMGLGLIEPIDDINDKTIASNPELMEFLTESMIDLDYDMKKFLRAIYNSRTYQSSAMASDVADPNEFYFNGPIVRRMSAEQIWDSLLTLTVPEVDKRQTNVNVRVRGLVGSGNIYDRYESLRQMTADELVELAQNYRRGGNSMMMKKKNNPSEARPEKQKFDAENEELRKKIRRARKAGNRELAAELTAQRKQLIADFRQLARRGGQLGRASEITSPAPAGHFLREFGQSDRETIENANSEPAVTQALSLMNGFLENRIANNNATVLMRNIREANDAREAVNIVYLSMLNRKPSREEVSMWVGDLRKYSRDEVVSDLIWTLANTNEFIFVK